VRKFYAWNRVANIIYIESPCGVGFSYGDTSNDYRNTDNGTAIDNHVFLQNFFQIYSEFSNNVLWIAGESYGGVYIPTLAYQVLTNSSSPQLKNQLLKGGLMLGNPVTGCDGVQFGGEHDISFMNTQINLFYWHAMVSPNVYGQWNKEGCNTPNPPNFGKCMSLYFKAENGIGTLNQPTQNKNALLQSKSNSLFKTARATQPNAAINPDCLYYSYCTGNGTLDFDVAEVPDCFGLDSQVDSYLNNPAVQAAINAKPKKWRECGGVIYTKDVGSLMPYLNLFFSIAPNLRILYYSGDIDIATVPFASTQRCLATLNRPVVSEWRPYTSQKEVAGYVEIYDKYTLATIKGAGHEAPQFQPSAAYLLFTSFLRNQSLPL